MDKLKRLANTKERLAEAMQEAGKNQADLVRETGLNKSIVSRCVSGKTEPGNQTVMKMARALNVSEMWLWGYDVPKARTFVQKTNDEIVDLIGWVQQDPELLEIVSVLKHMPKEEYNSFKLLILSRRKDKSKR